MIKVNIIFPTVFQISLKSLLWFKSYRFIIIFWPKAPCDLNKLFKPNGFIYLIYLIFICFYSDADDLNRHMSLVLERRVMLYQYQNIYLDTLRRRFS